MPSRRGLVLPSHFSLKIFRCFRRSPRFSHPCILVGPVVGDEPVAEYNRRIIRVPSNSHSVEVGTYGSVKTGGGKIKEVEKLGRVTIPLEQHLNIVQTWVGDAIKESDGGLSKAVFDRIEAQIHSTPSTPQDVESMQLDIFRAVIVNRMENNVFVYRSPSSFP